MNIRMYECGFGDCFRLREEGDIDLYVDFGIHNSSWNEGDRIDRFHSIIADMEKEEERDFLLTHYHDDHFNGVKYMADHTENKFRHVYVPDVWNIHGSVYITSLILLRGIFTKSVISENKTVIDFLESICKNNSRIYFISRGDKFHNNQYIALWPEKNYVARKAHNIFNGLRNELGGENLERIEEIATQLNELVVAMAHDNNERTEEYISTFNELRQEYNIVQRAFDILYEDTYRRKIQYKLTNFGNEISIVFQNYEASRNVLFTGDFGKKRNWKTLKNNKDGLVNMYSHYDVIKIPHHGTRNYYYDFKDKINDTSVLMIPNGRISGSWYVDAQYSRDSRSTENRTICAHCMACMIPVCPRGSCVYPKKYVDV